MTLCEVCEEELDVSDYWEVLSKGRFYYHRDCYARYAHSDKEHDKKLAWSLLHEALTTCYGMVFAAPVAVVFTKPAECHPDRKHHAGGLCVACYNRRLYHLTKNATACTL